MLRIIVTILFLHAVISLIVFQSEEQNLTNSGGDSLNEVKTRSQKFYDFEFKLLNQQVNSNIKDSIQILSDDFEKDYLFALINKRKFDYSKAFNLLYKHINQLPDHFSYYEELVLTAKASGNFEILEKHLHNFKATQNIFTDYLSALIYYYSNRYSQAIKLLMGKNRFESWYQISFAYRGISDYENALIALQKCKTFLSGADRNLAKVLIAEGSLYLLSGEAGKAEQIYKEGLNLAIKTGNLKEEAKALINLAIVDDNYGRVEDAKIKLKSALELSRKIENQELEATALSELGVAYTYTNEIVEARENYEKSLSIYKVLNSKERLSNLSANIASLFSQQGNYSLALKFYEEGLNYAGENIASKILNLRGMGDIYANLSNYSKSLKYYEKAKMLAKQIKNINSEILIDISIGTLFYNVNKPGNALSIFLEAKEKCDDNTDIYFIEDLYFKIGLALSASQNIIESNQYHLEALNIAKSVGDIYYEILISTELAYNYYLLKEFSKAENDLLSLIKKSSNYSIPQLTAVQNLYLGNINLELKKIPGAIDYYKASIKTSSNIRDYNTLISAQYGLAQCYEFNKNFQEAESVYKAAVQNIENLSDVMIDNSEIQITHFSGLSEVYSGLAELYLKQKRYNEAWEIIERSKSRNTFLNLSQLQIVSNAKDEKALKKYFDLKWKINSGLYTGNELKLLEDEYLLFKKNDLGFINNLEDNFSVYQIQKVIKPEETFVSYFLGRDKLYTFRLNKDNLKTFAVPISKQEIENMIQKVSPVYNQSNSDENVFINQDLFSFNSKASYDLYKILLSNVTEDLAENSKIIFSLPSEILLVPMEFLVTEFDENDSPFLYENKKYLIDSYAVSYTPSFSIYSLLTKKSKSENKKVLLVGDPDFDNDEMISIFRSGLWEENSFKSRNFYLSPLKYSRDEIENISDMFNDKAVLFSDEATETNFKKYSKDSKIIHLSTHSFLYKNQPLIAFSKGVKSDSIDDGYLEVSEIYNLKLNSDMVVLSSCRSGLGTIDKAEGILGMQKSFFDSGAKSVVVSIWDVNDKYTALFMKSFYEYLSDGYDKSEALRKAKIFFKKNYSANPYYWATFILAGNTSSLDFDRNGFINTTFILFLLVLIGLSLLIFIKLRKTNTKSSL